MLRDWEAERASRVAWIREIIGNSGVIFGNSGGKDCTLVGILCRLATRNVFGVIMPCESSRNFGQDRDHARMVAEKYDISTLEVDITGVKRAFRDVLEPVFSATHAEETLVGRAEMNLNPRLRMAALYSLGQSLGCLVAGTGNRSERMMGYFTKWGDGACDFNPISDLTVTEIYEFLEFLGAPKEIIGKTPSAGLYDSQTDEAEMGISYAAIDEFLLHGTGTPENVRKIQEAERMTEHKRRMPACYNNS